ncbi:MAG: hypothetical protein H7227_00180 [Actinobacteria bacterium]|nr:hypothetical protein [Actinomycetota bacterium]
MNIRRLLAVTLCALLIGGSVPAFAADADPARAQKALELETKYTPMFDTQYARLMALKTKMINVPTSYASLKFVLNDFVTVRRAIDTGFKSTTSDLDAVAAYADEELGEFEGSLKRMEKEAALIKTIACVKGKAIKKITAVSPKCPKGYTKKR